jgi:ABC-type spermidine/putrescine transport system permease subunit I
MAEEEAEAYRRLYVDSLRMAAMSAVMMHVICFFAASMLVNNSMMVRMTAVMAVAAMAMLHMDNFYIFTGLESDCAAKC